MAAARYAHLKPEELRFHLEAGRPIILPLGALEWHGDHLPLGLDGLVAEHLSERLGELTEGVVLPTLYAPITTLPHPYSVDSEARTVTDLLEGQIGCLARAGAQVLAVVTGHYAQGHVLELYNLAERLGRTYPHLAIVAGSPLEPLGDAYLDHAARYETSQMLAVQADLVDLSGLPDHPKPMDHAVLGEDPREASAEEGERLMQQALGAWHGWLNRAASAQGDAWLRQHYATRRQAYARYVDRYYRESWEQALRDWWRERTREE
jgi:creatinine amidohydrolase